MNVAKITKENWNILTNDLNKFFPLNLKVKLKHSMDALVWWREKKPFHQTQKKTMVSIPTQFKIIYEYLSSTFSHETIQLWCFYLSISITIWVFKPIHWVKKNPVQSPHTFFRSLKSTSSRTFTLNAEYFSIQRDKRTSVFLCVKKLRWSGVLKYTRIHVGCPTEMMVWEKTGR